MAGEHIITDKEAETVRKAREASRIEADVKRYTHWEIHAPHELTEKLIATGELLNTNKERIVSPAADAQSAYILVRYQDDFEGQHVQEVLNESFHIEEVQNVTKGTLWKISARNGSIESLMKEIIKSRILSNQYSQITYTYA